MCPLFPVSHGAEVCSIGVNYPLQVAHAGPGGVWGVSYHMAQGSGQELRHRGLFWEVLSGLKEGPLTEQGWRQGLVGAWQRVDTKGTVLFLERTFRNAGSARPRRLRQGMGRAACGVSQP